MKKIFDSKPARFPNNNTEEYNSVLKLLDLLDKNQIKPDPKLIDKFPNTDGEFTVTDEEQYTIGKCEIQIKTLPNSKINTPKYQCDLPFLSHCENSLLPVILIVVNVENEAAFWLHMDRGLLEELGKNIKGESINVPIPLENIITRTKTEYVKIWIKIIESCIKRKIDYEVQEGYRKKYEELYKLLEDYPKPIHTIGKENLKKLNIFIDTLNNSYDGDFRSIKQVVYSAFWKISIAYTDFRNDRVSFAIIPIKYGDNDLLIREVKSITPLIRDKMARSIVAHYSENPIINRPVEYAYNLIRKETLDVIKNKYLQLVCNQLVFEYLTDFYDYVNKVLPIKDKDFFVVKEYSGIFSEYFPIWVEEYNSFRQRGVYDSTIFFDIEEVFGHTLDKDKDIISAKALKRYKNKDLCSLKIVEASKKFSFKYIVDALNLLHSQKIDKFKRPYAKKTFKNNSLFAWSWYTPETAYEKLSFVFTELPVVYDLFIETYFPKIFNDLKFYSDFNLLIVNIKYGLDFQSYVDSPSIEIFYLKSEDIIIPLTKVYLNSFECPLNMENHFNYYIKGIVIDNVKYILKSISGGHIDFLFDKLTLQQFMYKYLEERFQKYFKIKTNEE